MTKIFLLRKPDKSQARQIKIHTWTQCGDLVERERQTGEIQYSQKEKGTVNPNWDALKCCLSRVRASKDLFLQTETERFTTK